MLSDNLENTTITAAPWAKAGTTAFPANATFLASEARNDYIDWFNAGNANRSVFRSPNDGEQMEGTLLTMDQLILGSQFGLTSHSPALA